MITIDQLQVDYGKHRALDIDRPIRIRPGERVGIIDSNGAGKTTLLHALLGLIPSSGSFRLDTSPSEIAVHLQQNNYVSTMATRHIVEAVTGQRIGRNRRLEELIEFFSFENSLKKRFSQLSGGQKQRLTLILILFQDAPLVFFDEVTSGLDFETRQNLVELLDTWYEESGSTVCYITHYYEELETLADKILLLEDGRVVCYGDKTELFRKYCRRSVFTLSRTPEHEELAAPFDQLKSPRHLIALRSPDPASDEMITRTLNQANVSYKRSTSDVEIMSYNAKVRRDA